MKTITTTTTTCTESVLFSENTPSQSAEPNNTDPSESSTTRKRKSNPQTTPVIIITPKKKKITKEESQLIAHVYAHHSGNWNKFMSDEKIQKLNKTERHLKNHINYLKTKKNQTMNTDRAKTIVPRGTRRDIDEQSEADDGEDTEDVINAYVASSEPESSDEQPPELDTPLLTSSQQFRELDNTTFDDSVSSSSVSSDFSYVREMTKRHKIRRAKKRQEEKEELYHILNQQLLQQQQALIDSSDWKFTILVMMMMRWR
ncbi:hypothetical protein FDP41_008779 [Naegleria fowleri]|uniref:Uncharacterized protein n=1 Tax=Naegleria fowleri TaxID=5763 RepID=A0A6A5B4Q4_NAEFO|nr:uncharacterized protein FDP41_008779 [Naegleria fowleri]KAF0972927.1 hypothetical protein FDP41_008779 [Naegleria fowleri]CAG4716717.1 unnamed protein product [Naegleria fowleri]